MKKLDSLGFLELNSIAKGIESLDEMLKAAFCELIYAKASCPGKYYICIAGSVQDVETSMEIGRKCGGMNVVGETCISNISPEVIRAINVAEFPGRVGALGSIEYYCATASIVAADAAVKAADVCLVSVQLGTGIAGKSYFVVTGDVDAVDVAIQSGADAAKDAGLMINQVVVTNPREELLKSLVY